MPNAKCVTLRDRAQITQLYVALGTYTEENVLNGAASLCMLHDVPLAIAC